MVKRGEIYWANWGAGKGSEQNVMRPALIIQNDVGNEFSPNVIIASITSSSNREYPILVSFSAKESGLSKDGSVDLGSVMTISKSRLGDKCGQFSRDKMEEVDKAICISLGIKEL